MFEGGGVIFNIAVFVFVRVVFLFYLMLCFLEPSTMRDVSSDSTDFGRDVKSVGGKRGEKKVMKRYENEKYER